MIPPGGERYFRWRGAVRRPAIWAADRHWYGLLGRLYLQDRARDDGQPEMAQWIASQWFRKASPLDDGSLSGPGRMA